MIVAAIVKGLVGGALGSIENIATAFINKQVSKEQFEAELRQIGIKALADAEVAGAEAEARIFEAAQETVRASFSAPSWWTRNVWAFVVTSQTIVLLWFQIGVPFLVYFTGMPFPRTGDDLLKWAYAVVIGALGVGVWQMRSRTTIKDIVDRR